jgi:hypothetical protein
MKQIRLIFALLLSNYALECLSLIFGLECHFLIAINARYGEKPADNYYTVLELKSRAD